MSTQVAQHKLQRDFGLFPIPRHLQHDPAKPLHFGLLLNVAFGAFATFTVANLYYCQPILGNLASAFGVSEHKVSNIPTLVQAGYAGGLLLITPLGDLVQRRQLILLLILCSASLTIGLAVTSSLVVFEALTFLIGVVSVVPQVLVPLAADIAPMNRKAGAIAIVWAALLFGILFARVLAGIIANFSSYRNIYYMATGLQFATLLLSYILIPNVPAKQTGLGYFGILRSMCKLAVTEPLLVQCAAGLFVSNMCFTNFWVTLTFLLLDAPYHYSTLDIGLFALLGMLGVALGPFLGRTLDFIFPWYGAMFSALWLLVFQAVMVIGAGLNIAPVVISTLGLDVFRQLTSVSLTSMVFSQLDPSSRSRVNAVMTFSLFLGQVIGTAASTKVFLSNGWRVCYGMALAWTFLQVLLLLWRGPHCPKASWFGWAGGWRVRKAGMTPAAAVASAALAAEKETPEAAVGPVSIGARAGPEANEVAASNEKLSRDGDLKETV